MLQRFSNWLLYASLFLLPWQTHLILRDGLLNNSPWEYGTISLYAIDILIVLSLIFGVVAKGSIELAFNRIYYRYLLCGLLIYLSATLPFSLSPSLSLYRMGYIAIAIILIFTLCETAVPFRRSALAFVLGGASSVLLGIWQFINQTAFASKWLGLAAHEPATLGSSVVEAIAPDGVVERWLRAYGSLDHPNMFGGFMAMTLIIASYLWLSRVIKEKQNRQESTELILIIVSTLFITAGLILSFSRGAWIAAALGIITVALFYALRKKIDVSVRRAPEFFAWAACLILVAGLLSSQYYYLFVPRMSGDTRLENISSTERVDGVKNSFDVIKRHPLLGTGLGSYTLDLQQRSPLKRDAWFYQPVHNTFLLIISEIGIIGALLLFATLASFIAHLWRTRGTVSASLIIASCLAILAIASLDHWLWSLHFGVILSGALLGLLGSYIRQTAAFPDAPSAPLPPLTE